MHDLVPADADTTCIEGAIHRPVKKLSLQWLIPATGTTQIVSANAYGGEARVYTLFRIPLDFFTIRITCDPGLRPLTLMDGEQIDSVGTFRDSAVEQGLKAYRSDAMGISFEYPSGYLLFENQSTFNGVEYHSFTIAPAEQMLQAIARARAGFAGEGPASIGITFMSNPKSLPLEQWMRSDTAHSNFNPDADPTAASSLASTSVAGLPARAWRADLGLYASQYVAFLYGDWVVVVNADDDGAGDRCGFPDRAYQPYLIEVMRMKRLLPLVALVLLLAAGAGYYSIHSRTSPATATLNPGWKRYEDKKLGFSVEYPPDFTVYQRAIPEDSYQEVAIDDPATQARYAYTTSYGRQSDLDQVQDFFTGPYPKQITVSGNSPQHTAVERTLNGMQGIEQYGRGAEGHGYDDTFMYLHDGRLWTIALDPVIEGHATQDDIEPGTPAPTEAYRDTYQRILSSIRISS